MGLSSTERKAPDPPSLYTHQGEALSPRLISLLAEGQAVVPTFLLIESEHLQACLACGSFYGYFDPHASFFTLYPGYLLFSSVQATSAPASRLPVHDNQVKKEDEVPPSQERALLHLLRRGGIAAAR
jgi:hypothetical protein